MSRTVVGLVQGRSVFVSSLASRGAPGADGADGVDGVNGGVGSSAGYGALKTAAGGMTVGAGISRIKTSGYSVAGNGGADYVYDAAVDAAYVAANPRAAFLAADGRGFRIDFAGGVTPEQFGALGDGATDDGAAFLAALAYLKETAANDNGGIYKGSNRLRCAARHYYLGTTTLEITHTVLVEGESPGMGGGVATKLRWAASTTGIRIQRYNTTGDRVVGAAHFAGDGSIIRGLGLAGGGGTTGAYHGIDTMARCTVEDCTIESFAGNGVNVVATAGGGTGGEGNANCASFNRLRIIACKNGMYFTGADANACTITSVDCTSNREWGFRDDSFLGNTFVGCHTSANVNGPYKTGNANAATVILGCYSEGDQPPSSLASQSVIFGGQHGAGVTGGSYVRATSNGQLSVGIINPDRIQFVDPSKDLSWGPNPENYTATIFNSGGKSYYQSDTDGFAFRIRGSFTNYATLDSGGLSLAAGLGYKINGTKVVGAQGAAVADATDAASAISQLNALLARMRAHGLIAT